MAKKKSKASKKEKVTQVKEQERVTMQALDDMSDSDDDEIPESQWTTKAKDLRQQIEDGKFDQVLGALKKAKENGDDDEEFEEDSLGSASSDDDDDQAEGEDEDIAAKEEEDERDNEESELESEGEVAVVSKETPAKSENAEVPANEDEAEKSDEDSDSENDEEEEDEEPNEKTENAKRLAKNNQSNSKALSVVTAELAASHSQLPWAETFEIIPPTPLPFGEKKQDDDSDPVDIHDDLKREVAFYNSALEAVHEARIKCKEAGIPFSRPEDFFAEMVKTDGKCNVEWIV